MERTLLVKGNGELSCWPDRVKVLLKLKGETDTYENSEKEVKGQLEKLQNILEQNGFRKEELNKKIEVSENTRIRYGETDEKDQTYVIYEYEGSIECAFQYQKELVSALNQTLTEEFNNLTCKTEYEIHDKIAAKNQLLEIGLEDAKLKSEMIATALGITLGEIVNITYLQDDQEIYRELKKSHDSEDFFHFRYGIIKKNTDKGIPIQIEKLCITNMVEITWKIL